MNGVVGMNPNTQENGKDPQFHGVQYNQMMDESKQTEEADISRSDFTETHSQDTIRNFQRVSDNNLSS